MRLLLVEDDFLIASAAEMALAQAGHEVVGMAPDAAVALAIARRRIPDLCLVDVNLRDGATGVAFAIALHRACGVRSLFATTDAARCRAAGPAAFGCLMKPYGVDELRRAVEACEALLQGRRAVIVPPTLELFEGES